MIRLRTQPLFQSARGIIMLAALRPTVISRAGGIIVRDRLRPPAGSFTSVSAVRTHTCGVRTEGSLACWGGSIPQDIQQITKSNSFISVSSSFHTACGIHAEGYVLCWGASNSNSIREPPRGSFISISAGVEHFCGLKANGTIACWGSDLNGESTPPSGTFISVDTGEHHACGVRPDRLGGVLGGQ